MAGLRDLRERVALVTGASSGIGAALARALASRGAAVALTARREDRLAALAAEIERAGGRASVHPADLLDRAAVESVVRDAQARHGRVDLLVSNAGFAQHTLVVDQRVEDVEAMLRTNYLGSVYFTHALLPALRARGAGWIVNVSSFAGLIPQPDEAAYSASKAALAAWSEAMTGELTPLGIHVMTVYPVLVRTEMFTPEVLARLPRGVERSFVSAEDFASAVLEDLARGRHHCVYPRRFGWVAVLRALAPEGFRRAVARTKLAGLPRGGS